MDSIDVFALTFAGSESFYYPGEVLNGAVILRLNKELELREIKIEFHGESRVEWTESRGSGDNRTTYTYRNNETYIDNYATLFGKGAKDNPVLPPGEYFYKFQFDIPAKLPSSFKGVYGHVRYWLNAVVDGPGKFHVTTEADVNITAKVDIRLNNLPNPYRHEIIKTLGCLCCKAGRLEVISETDRRGYCPGEVINASLDITNNSTKDLPRIELSLYRETTFIASSGREREHRKTLNMIQHEGVRRGNDGHFPSLPVPIPEVPPTTMPFICGCIEVHYFLKIKIVVSGCHSNLKIHFPIVIGSVPHVHRPPMSPFPPMPPVQEYQVMVPSDPPMIPMGDFASPSGMSIPPPAYSASASDQQDCKM